MPAVLRGAEEDVFADAAYTGADKRPEHEDRDVRWNIAIKRSIIKALPKGLRDLAEPVERAQALAQVRPWVEHPFHLVRTLFRHPSPPPGSPPSIILPGPLIHHLCRHCSVFP